ncbi:MAG: hypothetical protein IJN48_00645 [Clostridia bacterium]|nr:hypothetical protein [Clostridia bacterium]
MKKILTVLMALTLCIGLVACGGNTDDVDSGIIAPEVEEGTVGAHHWNAFTAVLEENADATVEELANAVLFVELDGAPLNQFMGGVTPMEVGTEYFPGFDNYAITGYESCANFMPMMGSIAYVGYIFELAEDADAQAFIDTLTANCNPRWQICVTADQTVVGAVGNKVFFLMCPATYDMPTEGGDMGGMAL